MVADNRELPVVGTFCVTPVLFIGVDAPAQPHATLAGGGQVVVDPVVVETRHAFEWPQSVHVEAGGAALAGRLCPAGGVAVVSVVVAIHLTGVEKRAQSYTSSVATCGDQDGPIHFSTESRN